MLDILDVQTAAENGSVFTLIYIILLSFVLSTVLAYVYQKTFRGLSFSRNYVQAIILISIIAAMVIQSVGDSLARGIGIMAAMAIIRFRTNLKDPRDTLFLFAGLAAGIACGAFAFTVAVVGTLGFSAAALLLYCSPLGPTSYFDGMLWLVVFLVLRGTKMKIAYTQCPTSVLSITSISLLTKISLNQLNSPPGIR